MSTVLVTRAIVFFAHKVCEQDLQSGNRVLGINHGKPQVELSDKPERWVDRNICERRWASQIDGK